MGRMEATHKVLLREIHLPKCGEPTTATKAQGAHTVLSRGKTPALLRADLQSPMMGAGPKDEVDYTAILCSYWAAGMLLSNQFLHLRGGSHGY